MSVEGGDQPGGPGARSGVDPAPNHLVVTVHGIRTYGGWQDELEELLRAAEPGIKVLKFRYNYFSSIAFLVPFLRWIEARRFRNFFLHEIRRMPPGARIDLVAHSFGTYLAACALGAVPEGRKVHTVIFAGSVLRPSFPWYRYQEQGKVGRVVNECGWDDSVLVLCQFAALWMGMAGRVGFQAMVGENFKNRFYRGGHGLYFNRANQFLGTQWLPLLTTEAPVADSDHRPTLTTWGGIKLFLLDNMSFIKVAGAVGMAMALVWIPIDWNRKVNFQKRIERFDHIARLTNAVQIPGRDPSHVRELLRIDVKARDGGDSYERSIDQMVGADAPEGEVSPRGDDEPRWWEFIPGLRDWSRDAYQARRLHAEANLELAGKQGRVRDLSKARLRFEDAIKKYEQVNRTDPSYGCYALCLLDYGRLLTEMGLPRIAIDQFDKVRTGVFPRDNQGKAPEMPLSVEVDSLCYKAEALKRMERWEEAQACQLEAARLAEEKKNDVLLSSVWFEIAWLKMERLDVTEAVNYFHKSKAACESLVDRGEFILKTRLYHVRHGLAMAERLLGKSGESYAHYDQIVKELKALLQDDLLFGPKERRDLRDRLVNSMERRADVYFFARKSPAHLPKGDDPAMVEHYRSGLKRVEDDYQKAIEHVADDDPNTRISLLYKKVITRFLAELAAGPAEGNRAGLRTADARPAAEPKDQDDPRVRRPVILPIDIEFAEAEQAFRSISHERRKDLKIHRDLAACCMKLRHRSHAGEADRAESLADPEASRSRAFDPQAVAELRALTVEYAARCDTLKREGVEMLLVGLEILLEPGVEDNPRRTLLDASRMMGVVGTTTQVASHEELQPYVARFHQIANGRLVAVDDAARPARPDQPSGLARSAPERPVDPSVLFYLRLSPSRAILVTDGPAAAPSNLQTAGTP